MGQFGAILRSFGIRFGYYDPKNWGQVRYCDPIVDTWGDLQGTLAKFVFAPDDEKPPMLDALVDFMRKVNLLIEKTLTHHGGKFAAGNSVTIADFVLASYVCCFIQN
mmetsp:Transcript_14914/g.18745  ORF Transcript_14914/g.18745 Transcript_14914/m.18745 type:complete len:107 (+) Transcript_14914:1148-1468(+)